MNEPSAAAWIDVSAPAQRVYALISDLPRMAAVAEEFVRGRWLDGAAGAEVGARFRGYNRSGVRRWSTVATVTAAEPGRRFGFDVGWLGFPVARWRYDLEPTESGCRVTESTWDLRSRWFGVLGGLATGVRDRAAVNRAHIEHTLAGLKSAVEAAEPR